MQCVMALCLSQIFWLFQPIGHDTLNQLSATIFPKLGMWLVKNIVVTHFGISKPSFVGMSALNEKPFFRKDPVRELDRHHRSRIQHGRRIQASPNPTHFAARSVPIR
jgi:hypothetical protein